MQYDRLKDENNVIEFDVLVDEILLDLIPNEYQYISSVLYRPLENNKWVVKLPKSSHDIVIVFTQDFVNVDNNISPELEYIDEFYNDVSTVVVIHWNHNLNRVYNGRLKLIEFPAHSFEFVQQLINNYSRWNGNSTRVNPYMCLNGIPKAHRKLVYSYLRSSANGILTLDGITNTELLSYNQYDWDNVSNFIALKDIYFSTPVNIITESLYNESSGIISEKSLMAFASLQLPIFIAHKGIIQDVKNYGFDTFDDILDNSYDTLPNDIRWQEALDRNKHILNGDYDYGNLLHRLQNNQHHLLDNYLNLLEDRLITQLTAILGKH
jgi:hypothetical protein